MIKLVISDLDGTLLHHDDNYSSQSISQKNIDAINRLKDQGIHFAIATGRGKSYKEEVEKQLGHKVCYVGNNGQEVVLADDTLISDEKFGANELHEVISVIKSYPDNLNLLTFDETSQLYMLYSDRYPFVYNEPLVRSRSFCDQMKLIDSCLDLNKRHFGRFSLLVEPREKELIKQRLIQDFGERYTIFSSDVDFIDLANPKISKGSGIVKLVEHFKINLDEIAVIGDEENDLSMFALTDHSYCMAHAMPHIQQKASHLVKSVAEMIESLVE